MEIVTGDQAPTLERTEALRLLQEMAAVVRTIFAVDAAPQRPGLPEASWRCPSGAHTERARGGPA